MKRKFSVLAGLLLCISWSLAHAEEPPPALKKRVMREIGLKDGQIDKIEDLTYKADRQKLDLHHQLQKAKLDLRHQMSADEPRRAKVFKCLEEISALELKLKKNRIGLMLDIKALMTAEQWEKLEMLQAERRAVRREVRRKRRLERRRGRMMAPERLDPYAPEAPPPDEPLP